MKASHLFQLLVVAVLLLGIAAWSARSRRAAPPSEVGQPVLPSLDVNAVRRIELRQGDRSAVVAFVDDAWVVTNLFGYPADFAKLRQNLLTLRNLKIADVVRSLKFDAQEATRVDLQDAQGKSLAFLRMGPKRQKASGEESWSLPDGRYVTAGDGSRVCLVKETLDAFEPNPKEWANTEILNVPSAEIATIEMTRPDGQTLAFDRSGGALKLTDLGEQEEPETGKLYGIESAMSYLRFTDVVNPALPPEALGFASAHVYRVSLKSGEIYTARIGAAVTNEPGADHYMRFHAGLAPATTNDAARAALEQKVADLNASLSPWTFVVSRYTSDNMTVPRADLVRAKTIPTNTVDTAAAPDAASTAEPAAK